MNHKGKGTAFLCALCLHSAALAFALQLRPGHPVAETVKGYALAARAELPVHFAP